MLIKLIKVIISQSIRMSNITLYILNACNFIYLNYISIKLKKNTLRTFYKICHSGILYVYKVNLSSRKKRPNRDVLD